jgi:putative Mg2+ transporter-C (MgtC) family protein
MIDVLAPYQTQFEILAYVVLAMLLGALIGLERETKSKPAGLRTHMLVAGAAALLVALGDVVIEHFAQDLDSSLVRSDPVRIMQAVVTGLSFLGAGTILRDRSKNRVEGLTTAASILFTAGVGMAVALEQFVLSIGATIIILITLRGVGTVEYWLDQRIIQDE